MFKLTPRQKEIFDLIRYHVEETGFPPTRAEIAQSLGFRSANAAEDHLKALARKGYIEMIPGASRGIRIVENFSGIPVVGSVAAGEPILSDQHIDEYQEVPPSTFRPKADFFLRVHGDSMVDAGILDGDLLAVHQQPEAENKQIVVARIDGEVTVKRLMRHPHQLKIHLLPENEIYEPINVDLQTQEFHIEGIAVGILRKTL